MWFVLFIYKQIKGLHGATAVQNKQTTQRKSKRAIDPLTTKIVTAGVIAAGNWLSAKIFGDKITETTTTIEQKMVPSTERALSGVRPISLNELNLRQPEKLMEIDLDNVINDFVKDVMMRWKKSNVENKWLENLSLFEKMNIKTFFSNSF